MRLIWLLLLAVLPVLPVEAATIQTGSCAQATVQNIITNTAANGDTVQLTPAGCSASWGALSIPSTKRITLDGNGANVTRSGSTSIVSIAVNSGGLTRVTNFNFSATGSEFAPNMIVKVSGCTYNTGTPLASFRIDHNTFKAVDLGHIFIGCHGRGLVDHNTFTWAGNNEVIHLWGSSAGDDTGWDDDVAPGTDAAVYFEDNTFRNTIAGGFLGGKMLMVYGARAVYRFNTIDCAEIDVHGNTPRSGRWWELYRNRFQLTSCNNVDKWYQIRGGSGYIFQDSIESGNLGAGTITFWQDSGKSPSTQDHVGLGKNQMQDPAYIWQSQVPGINEDDSSCGNCINANRDYYRDTANFNGTTGMGVGPVASRPATCTAGVAYWATDQGEWWASHSGPDGQLYKCTSTNRWILFYTPFVYPHPLQSGTSGTPNVTLPTAPTNLRVL